MKRSEPVDRFELPMRAGQLRDSSWMVLLVLAIAEFAVLLDITIVNVALPHIAVGLKFAESNLQWVISAYTLMFGGFLLLGGRIADLFGRRRLFVIGLVLFGAASLGGGLASTADTLIATRMLQGLGAALLTPAALSIVTVTFPHGRDRNIAMGIWGGLAGLGGTLGVVAGGLLVNYLSWRWVFFVNVPIVALTLFLTPIFIHESRKNSVDGGRRRFDVLGAILGTGGLLALVYGIVRAQPLGWGSTEVILMLIAGAVALGLFVVVESRSAAPLVPLGLFRSRGFTTAISVLGLNGAAFLAMFFLTALFLQEVRGDSALKAGIQFLPMGIAAVVMAVLASQLVTRIGTRPVQFGGVIASVAGLGLLSQAGANGSYVFTILPGLVLFGAGIIGTGVAAQIVALMDIEHHHAGSASGVINAFYQVGGALGLAVVATLSASRVMSALLHGVARSQALVDGYSRGLVVAVGFSVISLVLTFASPRRRPTTEQVREVL
ncbi:MFS transporter [Ferrimicrobium sp.]|uniref:MFS transporter n=1 Tax=Ferrimicrobium sp. TaxID=2926050 RepID=UPI00262CD8D6|nr:MFS transporter [Ferrimicrobium sp.]